MFPVAVSPLERQNERLEAFAGVVSHDLRNPLNVATARVSLAREGVASKPGAEHLAPAADALDRMEVIIDDVLSVVREGTRVDPAETARVSLADVAETCRGHVDTAAATLRVESGVEFRAAEGRIQRVSENLFRNAVEHGSSSRTTSDEALEDGGDVTVRVGALGSGNGFYVADDGPGIPADERNRVFEMGTTTDERGTGMGLYLVETIAGAHGWDVRVAEAESGGARFEFVGVETATDGTDGEEGRRRD